MGWRDVFQVVHSTEIPEKSERLPRQSENISDISHFSVLTEAKTGKAKLLDELKRLPKDLEQRIEYVAAFHAFTSDELEEAKEIASGDLENAAVCFRALCAEIQLCTKDNNR